MLNGDLFSTDEIFNQVHFIEIACFRNGEIKILKMAIKNLYKWTLYNLYNRRINENAFIQLADFHFFILLGNIGKCCMKINVSSLNS